MPGFAISLKTMLADFNGDENAARAAYCGLEAVVTTSSGVSQTLYIADAFDDAWVRQTAPGSPHSRPYADLVLPSAGSHAHLDGRHLQCLHQAQRRQADERQECRPECLVAIHRQPQLSVRFFLLLALIVRLADDSRAPVL